MHGQTNKNITQGNLQRKLRQNMTDAEKKLWSVLRSKQLNGMKFRRQHPYENFILDFVCLESKLIIEIDGGQHQETIKQDAARTQALEKAGFCVLRFWNHEVLQELEAVVIKIEQTEMNPSSPQPSP
jgi:very-short-patch-repair endonuclease